MVKNRSNRTAFTDDVTQDAVGRLRTSIPLTLFDSKLLFDEAPLIWDDQEISGASTASVYSLNKATCELSVANTTAGVRVRQTFMRFNYKPGKSQLVILTGLLGVGAPGLIQRLGIYDGSDGIFFNVENGVAKVTTRTSTSGSPVDISVIQDDWNLDTMDGKGPSRATIDLDKGQIFMIDFEWLSVGRVRLGFELDGRVIYCHEFVHANILNQVYMSTPNLPLRFEIRNDGTAPAATMAQICATVITESGALEDGILRYASTNGTHVDADVENTLYAIIGIRLKTTHLEASIRIQRLSLQIQTSSENGEWILMFNPTVADTFAYVDETNSAVQIARGALANTVTNGTAFVGGHAVSTTQGGGSGGVDVPIQNAILLGSSIAGVRDTLVLCWRPIGGTTGHDIEGSLTWRELS